MPVGQHAPALRTLCIFATGSLVVGGGAWVQGGCHMDCAFGYTLSHHAAAGARAARGEDSVRHVECACAHHAVLGQRGSARGPAWRSYQASFREGQHHQQEARLAWATGRPACG